MEPRAARRDPPNADYDALFELTATPTVEVDAAGVVVRVNAAATRLLGAAPDATEGTALDRLLDTGVTEALTSDGPTTVTARTADGPARVVLRSVRRTLRSTDGERITVQLTRGPASVGEQPSTRANELPWSALHDISHDLGTPLAIVAGYAETLAAQVDALGQEGIATAAAAIHRHAAHAIDGLRALQARVRFDTGGVGTVPTSVLMAWLRRMLDANLVTANAALVGAQQVDVVTVDIAVARQVLLNACTLALRSDPPPRLLELSVRLVEHGTEFVLRPEGPTRASEADFAGAAFTIEATRSLVEAGGGTYEPPTPAAPEQRIVLPTTQGAGSPGPTIRVAIIDDDPDAAALVRASLRGSSAPFEVVADERTFEAGLAAVATSQPHMVLLDQQLPDPTGLEGISELHALAPDAHLIVLSARRPTVGEVDDHVVWLEKGRVLADLGSQLIGVLAADARPRR